MKHAIVLVPQVHYVPMPVDGANIVDILEKAYQESLLRTKKLELISTLDPSKFPIRIDGKKYERVYNPRTGEYEWAEWGMLPRGYGY